MVSIKYHITTKENKKKKHKQTTKQIIYQFNYDNQNSKINIACMPNINQSTVKSNNNKEV